MGSDAGRTDVSGLRRHRGILVKASIAASALLLPLATGMPSASAAFPVSDVAPPCTADVPPAAFPDRNEIPAHAQAIDCVLFYGITQGGAVLTGQSYYLARGQVSREQMAAFLARAMRAIDASLPEPRAGFGDIGSSEHQRDIRILATAGIIAGTSRDTFDPAAPVTRAQTASLLLRAAAHVRRVDVATLLRSTPPFTDVAGSVHAPAIAGAFELGLVRGTTATTFAPSTPVIRAQMASLLARWLGSESPATAVCTAPARAFSVHHPAGYPRADDCSGFGSPNGTAAPPITWEVVARPLDEAVLPSGLVEYVKPLTVAGHRAYLARQLLGAPGAEDVPQTRFLVDLGGGRTLVGTTTQDEGPRLWGADGVLVRMGLSLDPSGSALPPFLPAATVARAPGPGGALDLVAVRSAHHEAGEGYDRIVLEFDGQGQVGWYGAEWDAEPKYSGSGDPVPITGPQALVVSVGGQVTPPQPPFEGPDRLPAPGAPVREVVLGGVYEALLDVYLDADRPRPFRVFRLAGPERLVIDVRAGEQIP